MDKVCDADGRYFVPEPERIAVFDNGGRLRFGNSNGDQAMLEYTAIDNPRPGFGMIVHHTDAGRECAYDSNPTGSGKLTTALEVAAKRGWTVVDIKAD